MLDARNFEGWLHCDALDFRFFFAYALCMNEKDGKAKNRPKILSGQTFRVRTPIGTLFLTLNENEEHHPFELFLNTGKCGSDITADAEAIGRLCSILLRLPSPVSELERIQLIITHLGGISGSKDMHDGNVHIRSVPDAVAVALRQYLERKSVINHRS
jgi:ribonucleoside-diphosphate reductase alpha chain